MIKVLIGSGILIWFVLGYIAAGAHYAMFQRKWPSIAEQSRGSDATGAWFMFWFGLIAFLTSYGAMVQFGVVWDWWRGPRVVMPDGTRIDRKVSNDTGTN